MELADIFGMGDTEADMSANHPVSAEQERGRALFRDLLELAVRLRSPGVTMLPGLEWPGVSHEDSLERAAAELTLRAGEAAQRGVRFSVEPHVGSVCPTPADVLHLCELAPAVELTVDHSHFVSQGFSDAEVEPLLGRARHVHMRGCANGRLQAPLRESTVDWERLVDALRECGYDGWLSIEFVFSPEPEAGLTEVDVVSECILLRDRLRNKLAESET
jgi:sugar phosphate isomerase/epimerase